MFDQAKSFDTLNTGEYLVFGTPHTPLAQSGSPGNEERMAVTCLHRRGWFSSQGDHAVSLCSQPIRGWLWIGFSAVSPRLLRDPLWLAIHSLLAGK